MKQSEVIFEVTEAVEGGYDARVARLHLVRDEVVAV